MNTDQTQTFYQITKRTQIKQSQSIRENLRLSVAKKYVSLISALLASLLLFSSPSFASPVLPLPDLILYGTIPHDPAEPLPTSAAWTLTYDDQTLTNLPVDFFSLAGLTYYVTSVPSVYTVSGTVPSGHLQVLETAQTLTAAFQSVGATALSQDESQVSFNYNIAELGTVHRLDLVESAGGYDGWLDDLYPAGLPNASLSDPNADSDSDGYTNEQEFLAGTDPNSSDIFPGMLNRDWWIKRGAIDTALTPQNLSPVALGQVKNIAFQGLEEVREQYPTVAPLIETDLALIFNLNGGSNPDNLALANLGQLKAVSHPFFSHLNLLKPWSVDQLSSNNDLAVLGQLKHLFDFPIQSRGDYFLDYGARYNDPSLTIQSFPTTPLFTPQDQDAGLISLNADGSIHLDGSAWKVLELPNGPNPYLDTPQNIELNPTHLLSFEFKKSGPTAEIYAIGLYHAVSDSFITVAFGGTQTAPQPMLVHDNQSIADEDWRKVVIPIGQFASDAGTLSQLNGELMLALINDADNVSGTHSYYRNIRLIDYTK